MIMLCRRDRRMTLEVQICPCGRVNMIMPLMTDHGLTAIRPRNPGLRRSGRQSAARLRPEHLKFGNVTRVQDLGGRNERFTCASCPLRIPSRSALNLTCGATGRYTIRVPMLLCNRRPKVKVQQKSSGFRSESWAHALLSFVPNM
jgi:hypothetical protein